MHMKQRLCLCVSAGSSTHRDECPSTPESRYNVVVRALCRSSCFEYKEGGVASGQSVGIALLLHMACGIFFLAQPVQARYSKIAVASCPHQKKHDL